MIAAAIVCGLTSVGACIPGPGGFVQRCELTKRLFPICFRGPGTTDGPGQTEIWRGTVRHRAAITSPPGDRRPRGVDLFNQAHGAAPATRQPAPLRGKIKTDRVVLRGLERNIVIIDGNDVLENGVLATGNGDVVENLTVRRFQVNGLLFTKAYGDNSDTSRLSVRYWWATGPRT